MTTYQAREKWVALNKQINYQLKVVKQNGAAGQKFDDEYLNWIKELMIERDRLQVMF